MALVCAGLNHRTAPLAVREKLAFAKSDVAPAVAALARLKGASEAVLISTCNRVEVYLVCDDPAAGRAAIAAWLKTARKLPATGWQKALETHEGPAAVRHLLEVTAGLDSAIVGEPQILSQVREAHETSRHAGASAAVLNGLFNRAVAAGKRVRTETGIGRLPASVASVAVDLAERILGSLTGRTVLLLGAGETAELVAEGLLEGGAPKLLVAWGRGPEKARALAARFGGEAISTDEARARLAEADVTVAATAAGLVLVKADVTAAMDKRAGRPAFHIDLSVPRAIDPLVADVPNAYLYNVDDLKAVADENLKRRGEWVAPAKAILEQTATEIDGWLESLAMVPVIRDLQVFGETCRQEVWAKAGRKVHDLPPEAKQEVEYLTQALVAKLLHRPMSSLKELSAGSGASRYTDLLRRLFKL